jgi:hypothetical protein
MRLDEYVDGLDDEAAERRRLAEERSYGIVDHLEAVERQFDAAVQGSSLYGSTAPSVFVGRSGYPDVSAGVLSPVDGERAAERATGPHWYEDGLSVAEVLQHRTSLVTTSRRTSAEAADRWDDFVGVQREVAIADHPVDVEVGLDGPLDLDLSVDDVATPTGPRARAEYADLAENPHVPRPVKKTLEDDEWGAEGAMTYLYRRDFDVYEIESVLSAGALGRADDRRLVPTRWSITAVDDTVGQYLKGRTRSATAVDAVEVYHERQLGNEFWVLVAPGDWEFELVEMKAPGSVWNPGERWSVGADHEGPTGRTSYVEETAGAYYAARLGVLEALEERERTGTVLVVRVVTDDYWAPTGVWVVREGVRAATTGEPALAESFGAALDGVLDRLPVGRERLVRTSTLAAGRQRTLGEFG